MRTDEKPTSKKSIKKNYFYNLIYQIFLIIVPLILTPYISRILTADGVGKISFSMSLIGYFTLLGSLGFPNYGQREIAKNQNDKYKQSITFWEVNICRLIPVFLMLFLNIALCIFNAYGDYNTFMWILNINIIALVIDISFLFQGNEDFGKLVLINIIIKIISIILSFLLVKSQSDIWIYILIMALVPIFSNIGMFVKAKSYLVKIKVKELKPLKHIGGTFKLFIPTIAISIYTMLDRTLLGLLIKDTYVVYEDGVEIIKKYSDLEVGYYEQSEKIVKILMTVITSIATVMIPRNSNEFAKKNYGAIRQNIYNSAKFVWFIGTPMVFGIILISNSFVPWFFGDGYEKCEVLLKIFSPLILIIGLSNVLGWQYLVPTMRDKSFTLCLTIGSITNLVLNVIFIPIYWSYGACIASVIAEFFVTLSMFIVCKKDFSTKKILFSSYKYLLAGIGMFLITFSMTYKLESSIINTFLIVALGIVTYFSLLIIEKDELTNKYIDKYLSKIFI